MSGFESVASHCWGDNYSELMHAEADVLERGGCTEEDAVVAVDMIDARRSPIRDEWAYFRTVALHRAAERLVTLRRARLDDATSTLTLAASRR
jgi:hypothetical protein